MPTLLRTASRSAATASAWVAIWGRTSGSVYAGSLPAAASSACFSARDSRLATAKPPARLPLAVFRFQQALQDGLAAHDGVEAYLAFYLRQFLPALRQRYLSAQRFSVDVATPVISGDALKRHPVQTIQFLCPPDGARLMLPAHATLRIRVPVWQFFLFTPRNSCTRSFNLMARRTTYSESMSAASAVSGSTSRMASRVLETSASMLRRRMREFFPLADLILSAHALFLVSMIVDRCSTARVLFTTRVCRVSFIRS